jgi:hypothetical protein
MILSCVFGLGAGQAFAVGFVNENHIFSIDDIVGDFEGRTYGTAGNEEDTSIICNGAGCPPTMQDKQGNTLYPIDSEFAFHVTDFAGAIPRVRDNDYAEGFAGNVLDGPAVIGLAVANVATDTFRVPSGLGTWCAGLGNTSVKCSAEQYVVMEHVKTCYETVPYMVGDPERANPVTGAQAVLDYDGEDVLCADKKLDNALFIIGGVYDYDGDFGAPGDLIHPEGTEITSSQILYDGVDGWLLPNESTVLENIAASNDYSVTGKDDGKPLYRWGDLHKRPVDIRMYARMALPDEWKAPASMAANAGLGLRVYDAQLSVNHVVTNNPNDQLRPEDMENEGAIGRKPGYVDQSVAGLGLLSDRDCYEADADFIPEGSVYQNANYPYAGDLLDDPYHWSSDLKSGWTNGYYTTVDREPFEWSYDSNGDGSPDVGYLDPADALPGDVLISGPRWRLIAQKFGQTVPGLEIPIIECSEPPYQKDNIKYDVGEPITTIINLLDWSPKDERSVTVPVGYGFVDEGTKVSPLAFTNGWVDEAANGGTVVNEDVPVLNGDLEGISINGAPVSDDFDLSVYVKGDKKATIIYDATLTASYQDDYVAPPADLSAVLLTATPTVEPLGLVTFAFTVNNPDPADVTADVTICGVGSVSGALPTCFDALDTVLASGDTIVPGSLNVPDTEQTITWTGTVTATSIVDPNPANDTAIASTQVAAIPADVDVAAGLLTHPTGRIRVLQEYPVTFTVTNVGPNATPVDGEVCATGSGYNECLTGSTADLQPGDSYTFNFMWTPPDVQYLIVEWTGTATAAGDVDPSNDVTSGGTTQIRIPQ